MIKRIITILWITFVSFTGGVVAQTMSPGGIFAATFVNWLGLSGSVSGGQGTYACPPTNSVCYGVNQIHVIGDTLSLAPGAAGPYALDINHQFGGAGQVGWAGGLNIATLLTATTSNASADYVGETNVIGAQAPDSANSALFAGNDNAQLRNGATGWLQLVSREFDIGAATGTSVQDKVGIQLVQLGGDAVLGSRTNTAFGIGNQLGASTGWDCAFCFTGYGGNWPFETGSSIMSCWPHGVTRNTSGAIVPNSSANQCGTLMFGIDLSNITFATGGAPFAAPLITPSSSSALCRQGAVEWDASFIYICTATNTWKRATLTTF